MIYSEKNIVRNRVLAQSILSERYTEMVDLRATIQELSDEIDRLDNTGQSTQTLIARLQVERERLEKAEVFYRQAQTSYELWRNRELLFQNFIAAYSQAGISQTGDVGV